MVRRYRSKPSEVDAIRWSGDNYDDIRAFCEHVRLVDKALYLRAGKDGVQGPVHVPVGHWIVCQPNDPTDYWPVDGAYFDSKYEEVR